MKSKLGDILRRTLGLKKKPLEWIEVRKKKKEFVSTLAVKYLKSDMYMFFLEKYNSNKTSDNIEAKPIADYIMRRYKYEQSQRDLARNKSNIYRRRQINERSEK